MRKIALIVLITISIVNLGKSQTLNVPDNIGTSSNTGKVGIGTIDPKAALHVETNGSFLRLSNNISNYFHSGIDGLGIYFEHVADSPEKSQMRFQTRNSNQGTYTQFFIDGANSRFTFKNGSVAIGNAGTGNHKLAVDGSIGAREIIIEAGAWSDFVFNKDYKLKDLEEVESFIEKNKHLPDIPSEKEVLENGFSLGEMDAKLLQKIEELTLYMIEQNKKTEKLIEKVDQLESENELLKNEINTLKTE